MFNTSGSVQSGRSHCASAVIGRPCLHPLLLRAEDVGLNMFELKQSHGSLVDDISRSTCDMYHCQGPWCSGAPHAIYRPCTEPMNIYLEPRMAKIFWSLWLLPVMTIFFDHMPYWPFFLTVWPRRPYLPVYHMFYFSLNILSEAVRPQIRPNTV